MKFYLTHPSNYDYQTELYDPLKKAFADVDIYYPHDPENDGKNYKSVMAECDVVLAEASLPSTGQGIELGLAEALGKPIVCFYKSGTKPSGGLLLVAKTTMAYENSVDLTNKLVTMLN